MAFLSLPNEIILDIVEYLDQPKQMVSAILVNRRLYDLLRDRPLRYNIRLQGSSALMWAARNGHLELVRNVLRLRPDVNTKAGSTRGETALHIAARNGFLSMAKLLLEAEADPKVTDFRGQMPLLTALESGYEEIAGMIFHKMNSQHTPIADSNLDETPLHVACRYKRPKATRYFLEAGADVNAKDSEGSTPFQHLLESNFIGRSYLPCDDTLEIVLALLEFGANPDPESLQTLRHIFDQSNNRKTPSVMRIGRTWIATSSEKHEGMSRPYINEICLHLNLLDRNRRQVELKYLFK
jgi:ankyrin repeat protein